MCSEQSLRIFFPIFSMVFCDNPDVRACFSFSRSLDVGAEKRLCCTVVVSNLCFVLTGASSGGGVCRDM